MKKAQKRFYYIKKLINNTNDTKERIDMFYFNSKAINFTRKLYLDYCMNPYYNIQPIDLLLMVDESKNICEVQDKIFAEYETVYATTLWSNFIECLQKDLKV